MRMQSSTGPYLLIAGGAVLLVAALVSLRLPMILFAAALVGLGVWALRDLDLSRFMRGPVLLGGTAVVIAAGALTSGKLALMVPALALAGLAYWARQRDRPSR
jgi:hypothetical protein